MTNELISKEDAIYAVINTEPYWVVQGEGMPTGESFVRVSDVTEAIAKIPSSSEKPNSSDLISRQDAIDAICEKGVREERRGHLTMGMCVVKQWAVDIIEALPSADRPTMTEEVREALMRLVMCAREECKVCKYEKECGFEEKIKRATENMHTIINAFNDSADRPTGRWLRPNETESGYYECSECGAFAEIDSVTGEYHLSNFCGECGAKLEDNEVDFLGGVRW